MFLICSPVTWMPALRVFGESSGRSSGGLSRLVNLICRVSPTFTRSTSGLGRLPGRSMALPGPSGSSCRMGTTSRASA
ncbi:hypothetical protein BE21_04675 [Sorangium cellulosum]|uniref:Uncharacterized protein n=1 Tax=Sorangium cellulosum TaxID=56 RepID=A0A150TEX2_SORCE|nr:hypothetical protein BE21_04675 [Sorangium cellulosum]